MYREGCCAILAGLVIEGRFVMVVQAVSLVETLGQLYLAIHKYDPIREEWSRPFEYALGRIEKCSPSDLSYAALESWSREEYDDTGATGSDWFRRILLTLPPALVHQAFGEEVLGWIVFHNLWRGEENFTRYLKYYCEVLHLDPRELEIAKSMSFRLTTRVASASVLKSLELMKALLALDEEIGPRFCRPQMKLSPEHLSEYRIVGRILPQSKDQDEPVRLYGYDLTWARQPHGKQFAKWMPYQDAPLALYLVQKGRPQAVLSFVTEGVDRLYVQQIQGLKGVIIDVADVQVLEDGKVKRVSSRGLVPILWQELLLSTLASLGKQLGYKEVVIQGAENNRWTKPYTDSTIHLPMERALKAYDEVAESLGAFREDNADWSISINRLQRQLTYRCPQ